MRATVLPSSLIGRIVLLALVSAVCALAINLVSPRRIAWRGDWDRYIEAKAIEAGIALVDLEQAKAIVDANTHMVIDARHTVDYDAGHLPGALSLPYDAPALDFENVIMLLTPEQLIMTYCSGLECDESFELSISLREQGFTNIVLFAGGFNAWDGAGLTVQGR